MKTFQCCVTALMMGVTTTTLQAEPVDFELSDVNGHMVKLSDYRGKWVIVNYWATWCPPCRDEIPELVDFHERHQATDAVVLGVAMEDVPLGQLAEFADGMFINYPVLKTTPRPVPELGRVAGLPTTFIVSPEGELIAFQEGPITAEHLDGFLKRKASQKASQ